MNVDNYNNKRIYKVKLDYEYFRSNNLGSKVRETLEQIEENQSFLIVYTLDNEINELNEPLGYYLYNTRIIISPLAIKQKKEITKSLVELIKNSKFDEDKPDHSDNLDNDGVLMVEDDREKINSTNR
jgi:hypothetical protein